MPNTVQYKINLPEDVYKELQKMADENNVKVSDLLRKGVKWQLLLGSVKRNNGQVLIKRDQASSPIEIIDL